MRDGGYARPELWLSDGWRTVESERWRAPLYWLRARRTAGQVYTLAGCRAVDADEVVAHVSYYEADAYARWAGARLADGGGVGARRVGRTGRPATSPMRADCTRRRGTGQCSATSGSGRTSAYGGYPGYRAPAGPIGEYNGKFMSNQMVLRGGSCLTPAGHVRATYRNFFPPAARWQMSGIRLARDL